MRIFKNKWFTKFADREGISDTDLCDAMMETETGLIDADYGGCVIKKRIARPNEGKSGGYRSIILYRQRDKAFFVFGYPKKDRDNLKKDEVADFKKMAKITFELSEQQLNKLVKEGVFRPVKCHEQEQNV